MKKSSYICLTLALILSFSVAFSLFGQEKKETDELYTVKRGDTLWDISARFLKNPYLWPRLWQRNPYITNPHWIYPGNTVRLEPMEGQGKEQAGKEEAKREEPKKAVTEEKAATLLAKEPERKKEPQPDAKKPEVVVEKKIGEEKPVFPEVRFAGFYSDIDFRGVGYVLDSREGKNILSAGDICYIGFRTKDPVSIGDKFTTFSAAADWIWVENRMAKRYNITGIIQIIDQYGSYYTARIIESFQEINRGDRVMIYDKERMEVGINNQ